MGQLLGLVFGIALFIAAGFGWINNLVGLFQTDFEAPYKAEIIRGVGVFVPPVGVIAGYVDIADGKAE